MKAYFKVQLDQYLDWLYRCGLSETSLDDAREEVLDHDSFMEIDSAGPNWLPVARFKRKMNVSDTDWDTRLPRIAIELRKGRQNMLMRVLDAAERREQYSYHDVPATTPVLHAPAPPTSSPLRTFMRCAKND